MIARSISAMPAAGRRASCSPDPKPRSEPHSGRRLQSQRKPALLCVQNLLKGADPWPSARLLLPLTGTAAGEAALATSLMIARRWNAHVLALHVRVDSRDVAPLAGEGLSGAMIEEMMSATEKESAERAHAVRSMFEQFVTRHNVIVQEAHGVLDHPTASFAAVTGREEDIVAQQARLADLTVVPHPDSGDEVSSSDALHAVLFDSGRPVLISPRTVPATIGARICLAWNGTAESASSVTAAMDWLVRAEGVRDFDRRGLPASRTGCARPRSLLVPAWYQRRDRHIPSGRRVGGCGFAGRGVGVQVRPALDGGLFAFPAAAVDPGRRHPPRAGEFVAAGDDEPVGAGALSAEVAGAGCPGDSATQAGARACRQLSLSWLSPMCNSNPQSDIGSKIASSGALRSSIHRRSALERLTDAPICLAR